MAAADFCAENNLRLHEYRFDYLPGAVILLPTEDNLDKTRWFISLEDS